MRKAGNGPGFVAIFFQWRQPLLKLRTVMIDWLKLSLFASYIETFGGWRVFFFSLLFFPSFFITSSPHGYISLYFFAILKHHVQRQKVLIFLVIKDLESVFCASVVYVPLFFTCRFWPVINFCITWSKPLMIFPMLLMEECIQDKL